MRAFKVVKWRHELLLPGSRVASVTDNNAMCYGVRGAKPRWAVVDCANVAFCTIFEPLPPSPHTAMLSTSINFLMPKKVYCLGPPLFWCPIFFILVVLCRAVVVCKKNVPANVTF